ncbi:MAG: DUF3027 domain-containing protein [Rhodoglobus sp.]
MPPLTDASARVHELARDALREITPDEGVGAYCGQVAEGDGIVTVLFDCALAGYPGWRWTVSVATVEGQQPTVLEAELMPGEGALLAPDWVPWSDRLAEYTAAQEGEAVDSSDAESADDTDTDDDIDEDDDDVLHSGDLDGVDIDDLDESAYGNDVAEGNGYDKSD